VLQGPSSGSHRERQRRYRARQRNGEVAVTVFLTQDETGLLQRLGCLDVDRLEDRSALATALHLLLASVREA
jgi:hypothetical protein